MLQIPRFIASNGIRRYLLPPIRVQLNRDSARTINFDKLSNKRLESDIELESDDFKSRMINRNPRNLEQLSFEKKPAGWWLEESPPSSWNKLVFEQSGRYSNAYLQHWSGRKLVEASTKEPRLSKYYKGPNTTLPHLMEDKGLLNVMAARSSSFRCIYYLPRREFHAAGSKVHYMDFRHRLRVNHLRLHLLIIRRQKMKKHQRRKWRRKFKALIAKKRLKREIAKEKTFRVELLSMIRKAENFDPREYALQKIAQINNAPKELTKEERLENLKQLIRENRYQVDYIKPKHRKAEI